MKKIALFAGTFNPYTLGHHSVVQRALAIFDKVVVAVGKNMSKHSKLTPEEYLAVIERVYADEPRVQVVHYEGLTVDYARKIGAAALLRGVRSVKDFEYERELADVNLRVGGIETVILFSTPEYSSISSSVVRELAAYGKDVTPFLP
ncbi:MAG: pantetheine-phosphate adenylyltransferase [Bacteroidaceae bacterium]|nr:pantetheine-phosphate adenylyltransferase [Bacteroidaceae bacterium]